MSSADGNRPSSPELPAFAAEDEGAHGLGPVPVPFPPPEREDQRSLLAWRQWLTSMATDAEAALAAAMAYRQMDASGRDDWVDALGVDVELVAAPRVALCAPLLAVETDERRSARLWALIEQQPEIATPCSVGSARSGRCDDGTHIYVVSTPLYLDFVQVLACGVKDGCFTIVRHDPIVSRHGVPEGGQEFLGARLEVAPLKAVLDELALAVLTHQRAGHALPDALTVLSDLLGPLGP